MAWPPATSTAFLLQGVTTIKWGTDGIWTGYTVVSCTPNDEVETLYVENGTGLKSTRIILWQGRRMNITVVDDTTITPPTPGSTVTLANIISSTTGSTNLTFRIVENSYNAARKEAGQRVLVAEYLTNIEGSGVVPG